MQVELGRAVVVSRTRIRLGYVRHHDEGGCRRDPELVAAISSCASRRASANRPTRARPRISSVFRPRPCKAALGWDAAKSRGVLHGMSSDAGEYLTASRERGDVYVAGKTEEHVPGGVSLGLIASGSDRTFVIVGPAGQ